MRATPQRPSDRGRISPEQLVWIQARDGIGAIIDRHLNDPAPAELRPALALVEDALRAGDRVTGLLRSS